MSRTTSERAAGSVARPGSTGSATFSTSSGSSTSPGSPEWSESLSMPAQRPRSGRTRSRLSTFAGFSCFSGFSGFSAFSGDCSIRVSTSTGTRPLASASRSATRSPVRPSNSTLVVRASRTTYASPVAGGSSLPPSAVASSSSRTASPRSASWARTTRGCTTIWPSRSHEAGERTSTCSMSCQRRPLQVSPRRTRTPWSSATISGARPSRTTSSWSSPTVATTQHHSQSRSEPVWSARENQATVITAAASATVAASLELWRTVTPITAPPGGWRSRHRGRRA